MKKIVLTMSVALLLIGCGSDSDLSAFADEFNQNARKYDAIEIMEDEFGDMEYLKDSYEDWIDEDEEFAEVIKNSEESSITLFESKEYSIESLYDAKKHTGYSIRVNSDTDYINKDSKGYKAVLTIADTLGVNIKDLENGMQNAFNDNFYDYEDDEYEVKISVINIVTASLSITFEKKQ